MHSGRLPPHLTMWPGGLFFIDFFFFLKGEISIFAIWSKFARLKAKLTPRAQEIFFQSGKLDLRIYESVDGGIDTPNFFPMSREYHLRYLEQVRALKGPT